MTLKLTLFSQEVEDFVQEILIDSDATFACLHQLILKACNYDEREKQCFLICDEEWRVRHRICLHEDEKVGYDRDINLMDDTRLGDFLEDEGQRMAYAFDPEGRRVFLLELTENVFGRKDRTAVVSRRHGQPPLQTIVEETGQPAPETTAKTEEMEEEFYGDDGFEADELDMEGYEIEE